MSRVLMFWLQSHTEQTPPKTYTCQYNFKCTDLVVIQGVQKVAMHYAAVHRDCPRTLNELKTAITAYIRNISQADLQKVFANKIKCVQACIDACGHHFQHLL